MNHLLKMSEAASLALHAAAFLAARQKETLSTRQIAESLGVSGTHLSKVLQRLAKSGLVKAKRGPAGGFELIKPIEKTTLKDVYEAIEGKNALKPLKCMMKKPVCNGYCILGDLLIVIDDKVRQCFSHTTLLEIAGSFNANLKMKRKSK